MTKRWNIAQTCHHHTLQPHRLQPSALLPLRILEMQGNIPPPRTEHVTISSFTQTKMPQFRNMQKRNVCLLARVR